MLRTWARPKFAGLGVTWIAAVAVVLWLVLAGRQEALRRGLEDTAALTAVIEQLTARTFQALYLTLSSVADAHQLQPRPAKNDPAFQQLLTYRLQDVPFARALFIIGPDGWLIHDTDYPSTPNLSLFDRPYFQAYLENSERFATAWPPLESRSGTGWFVPVTEPLSRSAEFEGVVAAALQADHFTQELERMGLANGYFAALFHRDGTFVASYPARPEDVGRQFPELPDFSEYMPGGDMYYQSDGWLLPGERAVSYGVLENAPLVVMVSLTKDGVLAEWKRTATAAAIAMLGLTAVLVWLAFRFAHEEVRRERERQRRAQVEKLEALGQITGGIAHDFSNALQLIAMNVQVLRLRGDDPDAANRALENTERAVQDASSMVERLLAFSRKKPLKLSRLHLGEWLETARPLLSQAAGPGVSLAIDRDRSLPEVLCDVDGLDMALVNLVVNSRHALHGSGRVRIRAFACDRSDAGIPERFLGTPPRFVCLSVEDNGPGMTEDVKRRAMEPFFSTKGDSGTGLGLSQVYGFARQLGGGMAIESTVGRGTTVLLFLPVAPPEDESSTSSAGACLD